MNCKMYQKPKMKVETGIVSQMMAVSNGVDSKINGYGNANEQIWGDDDASGVNEFNGEINWDN